MGDKYTHTHTHTQREREREILLKIKIWNTRQYFMKYRTTAQNFMKYRNILSKKKIYELVRWNFMEEKKMNRLYGIQSDT